MQASACTPFNLQTEEISTGQFGEYSSGSDTWAEAVTLLKDQQVPDEVYEQARRQFDEKALVDLTLAIVAINGWNRLSVSFRTEAGSYQPGHH